MSGDGQGLRQELLCFTKWGAQPRRPPRAAPWAPPPAQLQCPQDHYRALANTSGCEPSPAGKLTGKGSGIILRYFVPEKVESLPTCIKQLTSCREVLAV